MNKKTPLPAGAPPVKPHSSTPKPSVTEQVKQQAQNIAGQAHDQALEAKEVGEKKIRQATQSVQSTSRNYLKLKKTQAAAEVGVFRDAVQKAAEKLSEEDHQGVASYVSAAAEQLDRLRESIEERQVGDLLGEAQRIARKHPEVVYGGLFVAGLAIMRFLKASCDGDEARQATTGSHPTSDRRPERTGRGQHTFRQRGFPQSPNSPQGATDHAPFSPTDNVVPQPTHNV